MECFLLLYLFLFIIISLTFFDYSIMQFFMDGQISQNPCYLSPHHDAVLPLVICLLKQWQHPHLHHFKTIVSLLQGTAKSNIFTSWCLFYLEVINFQFEVPQCLGSCACCTCTEDAKYIVLYIWLFLAHVLFFPFTLAHVFSNFAFYTLQMVSLHLN